MGKVPTKPIENECPLNCSEWVNFLATESTLKRHDYYNKEVSLLTVIIILLTAINVITVFVSLLFQFEYIPDNSIIPLFVFIGAIFIIILLYFKRTYSKLKNDYQYMDGVIEELGNIICDVLNGELTDTNEIRKRYMDIWNKEKWKEPIPKDVVI